MYAEVLDSLYKLFGESEVALCLDCFTLGTLDSFVEASCPACSYSEHEGIRVFNDVETLITCLEAQDVNIHGIEVVQDEDVCLATFNFCYVDLFTAETRAFAPAIIDSLVVA